MNTFTKFLMLLSCAMYLAVPMTACRTIPNANQQLAIAVAIDVAAGAAIQQGSSDPGVWHARAANFEATAKAIKAVNDAGVASLDQLAADLRPIIAKLPPADQLAANALVTALVPYLKQEIGANPQLGTTQQAVDVLLDDVIAACAAYTGA